jgi:1-deoxy-D-xylulose-5-phosphate synthase
MAIASSLKGENGKQHIAVIGDASIASGMAFEALNHAGVSDTNLLIILNDNAIGIDPSVGALKEYLTKVKTDRSLAQNNIIRALNFDYSGPIDGHDFTSLLNELKRLKEKKGPKFLHVITTKGKGLKQAEKDQVKYHSPGKFDAKTGDLIPSNSDGLPPKYQDVFGESIVELTENNDRIVGITPAMLTGSSLKLMLERFPERTFDVGIAEQHAVTLSAGLATQGMIPFCNIYSTFLQRAYDQVIHDVALQNLPVIFCLDRAGLVGEDGATHHGIFDLAYLRAIPNMIVFAPRNEIELRNIMYTAQLGLNSPIAIRYPRGRGITVDWKASFTKIDIGRGVQLKQGKDVAVLSVGSIAKNVTKALENELTVAHYDMRFVKPLDENLLHQVFEQYAKIVTVEDGVKKGGFGSAVLEFASENEYSTSVEVLGIEDTFTEHGSIEELQEMNGLDPDSIRKKLTL